METPVQAALRLLAVLEELAGREEANLLHLNVAEAVHTIETADPVVKRLAELAEDPDVLALRPRVEKVLTRRRQSAALIDAHLARLQAEMKRVDEARGRLGKVAPAYGAAMGFRRKRLNTAV